MKATQKIAALRKAMQKAGLAAYIVPSSDPHLSEYLAEHWQSRKWISGFTGSAGTVVVTHDHAGLWTDSRYFLQAERQLKNSGIELHKLSVPHTAEHLTWLSENLPEGSKIGFDGQVFSVSQVRSMAKTLENKKFKLDSDNDLFTAVWKDRPALPDHPIFEHVLELAGKSRTEKLAEVRAKMSAQKADFHLVSALDEIAWLFNLRGSDVESNPVFVAYAIVAPDRAYLFLDEKKLPKSLANTLNADGIVLKPYAAVEDFLKNLPAGKNILLDKSSINLRLFNTVAESQRIEGDNIIAALKTIKNQTEIGHYRRAMIKDGVALVKLFRWLEAELEKRVIPETEVSDQLITFRKAQAGYFGESFSAIVGYGSNGAIVHYRPEPKICAKIRKKGILLLDCGGQYTDGTTDITRTVALSRPTTQQKTDFTLVLKGNLAVAMAHFPKGSYGIQFDALARQYLWRRGRNFGHGTGHGVGFFLNVHEGPQSISAVVGERSKLPFEPGMVTSNEPGLYRAGQYGIRIENLVLCVEDEKTEFGDFLKFETLSLFPIDVNLIDKKMLDSEEKRWFNDYHQTVFERLSPNLNPEEKAWLKDKCKAI